MQDRLDKQGSKVMTLVCAPGLAASNLAATTASSADGLVNSAMKVLMRFSQSAEDGTMPLLACMCAEDAKPRAFYRPAHKGLSGMFFGDEIVGPAKKFDLETKLKTEAQKSLLWEASEAACGPFFA